MILASLTTAYVAVFGVIAAVKFHYYLYADFDLAIFAQATDQALRGNLYSSIRGMYWLGDHVSLIVFVLAPLYAVVRHPLTLLFLQSATLGLGALPVFGIARRVLGHDGVALSFSALYLLHPAVGYTNLFEFHPEVLATSGLLAAFWALTAGRFGLTLLFTSLALACREDVALVVLGMGLLALRSRRPRRFGITLLGLAGFSLVLSFAVFRPAFESAAVEYGRMYDAWGTTPAEIAGNLLRDPLRAVSAFFSSPGSPQDELLKRHYWPHMLGPLLFLPLLSPGTLLMALPVLAEHFLSSRPQQHWLLFQYTALVTPVFVIAAVQGLANLLRMVARTPAPVAIRAMGPARSLAIVLSGTALAASLFCNLLYGPLLRTGWVPVPPLPQPSWPTDQDRVQRPFRDRMVARIPREGGVVAAFEFLARLASRPDVHSLHHLYTGFHTFSSEPYPIPAGITALIADVGDDRLSVYVKPGTSARLRHLVDRNDLRPVDAAGDLLLFVQAATDTVELFRAPVSESEEARAASVRPVTWDGQLSLTGFALPESSVAAGGTLSLATYWRRAAVPDRQFIVQFVLRDAEGAVRFSVVRHLGYLLYPVTEWPAGAPARENYRLVIPPRLPPGRYALGLRVAWWREGPAALSQPDDPSLQAQDLVVPLGRFTVTGPPRR